MKIALIGPGIMPIPPEGWGAVEMLIWDYYKVLLKHSIQVDIINTADKNSIIEQVNNNDYDVVHVHYDMFVDIIPSLKARLTILSSHYPFISEPNRYSSDGYNNILSSIVNNKDFYIFASSQRDIDTFIGFGADKDRTFLSKLGTKTDSYTFYNDCVYDRTLCFSQIVPRKRQSVIQTIEGIDFIGKLNDTAFNTNNYKGELPRDVLNKEISKYANFILLSLLENATPLVVKEALICGLGVVVSESVSQELDTDMSFISVIPEDKVTNLDYVHNVITENKEDSKKNRSTIRQYGIDNFDFENILINSYLPKIRSLL